MSVTKLINRSKTLNDLAIETSININLVFLIVTHKNITIL